LVTTALAFALASIVLVAAVACLEQRALAMMQTRWEWRRMLARDVQQINDRACEHLLLSPRRISTPADFAALCDAATILHNAAQGAFAAMMREHLGASYNPTYYRRPQPRTHKGKRP
jgi:hypothetical protein